MCCCIVLRWRHSHLSLGVAIGSSIQVRHCQCITRLHNSSYLAFQSVAGVTSRSTHLAVLHHFRLNIAAWSPLSCHFWTNPNHCCCCCCLATNQCAADRAVCGAVCNHRGLDAGAPLQPGLRPLCCTGAAAGRDALRTHDQRRREPLVRGQGSSECTHLDPCAVVWSHTCCNESIKTIVCAVG